MPFASASDGIRLYFEEMGAGDPLLLLAGSGMDHRGWLGVPADFASQHRVITLDYRGLGNSDKHGDPSSYTTRNFAQDALTILDQLDIRRAHAYGASLGGSVSIWLAHDAPERVGALVLACSRPGPTYRVQRNAWVDAAFQNPDSAVRERAFHEVLFSPAWIAANPQKVAAFIAATRPSSQSTQHLFSQADARDDDLWDMLPRLTAPTLVLHGADDPITPLPNGSILRERMPGAELYVVDGGRHCFMFEFQQEASAVVLEFLARHPLPVVDA